MAELAGVNKYRDYINSNGFEMSYAQVSNMLKNGPDEESEDAFSIVMDLSKDETDPNKRWKEIEKRLKITGKEKNEMSKEIKGDAKNARPELFEETVTSLFESEDLSEEAKQRIETVFEALVEERVTEQVNSSRKEIEEEFDRKLDEAVETQRESMVENLDKYLDLVVKEWSEENKVAIEAGIKVEMAESLMDSLKDVFEAHNIKVNEDTVDVVSELESQIEESDKRFNEMMNANISLKEELDVLKKASVFTEVSEGLANSQIDRLRTLSESIKSDDIEDYKNRMLGIKKAFFEDAKTQERSKDVLNESNNELSPEVKEEPKNAPTSIGDHYSKLL